MTPGQAVVLALIQALTEFLPISSSGHLILAPRLLGWTDQGLEFDIATNTGTLLAIVAYFRRDLAEITRGGLASLGGGASAPAGRMAWALALGTLPAAVAGLLVKDLVASQARRPGLIAATAIVYGLLLLLADRLGSKRRPIEAVGLREGLLVGCAQALALVPGTSRSGVTMTAGLALGLTREAAARFAFLLAVPIGLLVGFKQLVDLARGVPLGVEGPTLALGIAVSALAGYAVIAALLAFVRRFSLAIFAVYRLLLGVALLLWF
ncbi:MAG TPA: undecaprenyl-diphosphate phosphatase [Thermoanaerobaculia bacterium]|nr:undecaprenyl-diphosphate phosphatase [Thermoanaerobaculia bacterium]